MTRDTLVLWLTGSLTAGGMGGAIAVLISTGFKSDDVFAFSGAVIGAAATVAGTAWLSDRGARRDRKLERDLILRELLMLEQRTKMAAANLPGDDGWTDAWRAAITDLDRASKECRAIIVEALSRAKHLSFRQRAKLVALQSGLEAYESFYYDAYVSDEEMHPLDEREWPWAISRIVEPLRYSQLLIRSEDEPEALAT